jgi:tryptophanyl-tRNA synthetase
MSEYENTADLKENIIDNVADWLACGISPRESTIFIQSQVKEHLELNMVFSIITPLGLLERCPTYKEQMREITNRNLSTYGFLGYPVLQAADILLYQAEAVPVGEDQLPHLELTRQIARKFNHIFKKDFFVDPKALLTSAKRLAGLDGRKMSKSYNNAIALSDAPEVIAKKIQNMFTDPSRIRLADPGHPDKCNVYNYYGVFAAEKTKEIAQLCPCSKIGCTECKKQLAGLTIKLLEPLQEKRRRLLKDKHQVWDILAEGQKKASAVAARTMLEVRKLIKL